MIDLTREEWLEACRTLLYKVAETDLSLRNPAIALLNGMRVIEKDKMHQRCWCSAAVPATCGH